MNKIIILLAGLLLFCIFKYTKYTIIFLVLNFIVGTLFQVFCSLKENHSVKKESD